MHLRLDLIRQFETELVAYEKELHMPYVTSVERIAEERGLERGSSTILLRILAKICGPLPDDVLEGVRKLSFEDREILGEASICFRSVEELRTWLKAETH